MQTLGPIGWLFKILMTLAKAAYWIIRLVVWILRKLYPRKSSKLVAQATILLRASDQPGPTDRR